MTGNTKNFFDIFFFPQNTACHETLWHCFRQWVCKMKLWPLRMAWGLRNINVWRSMKMIQTKHLKNSVAQKQVSQRWEGMFYQQSPSSLTCNVMDTCPAPLSWDPALCSCSVLSPWAAAPSPQLPLFSLSAGSHHWQVPLASQTQHLSSWISELFLPNDPLFWVLPAAGSVPAEFLQLSRGGLSLRCLGSFPPPFRWWQALPSRRGVVR